jgi:hypothetical protein
MVVLTALIAIKKGKLSEEELLQEKVGLLRLLLSKGFSREKISSVFTFLNLYIRFKKEATKEAFEKKLEELLDKPKETMGIVEFVIERERRVGEKKGLEAANLTFVKSLIEQTDFSDEKIASLASVTLAFVEKVRTGLKK